MEGRDVREKIKSVVIVLLIFLSSASCTNIFTEAADKTSDQAKLFDARKKIDSGDWTGAITKILSMSATAQAQRDVRALLASAYAGRCGLDVLALISNITSSAGNPFFKILMNAFVGATASKVADCRLAEDTINLISTNAGLRTTDENLLMAFIGFSKVGAILSFDADTNSDLTVDVGYDPCAALDDTQAAELITGMANAIISFQASGFTVGDGTQMTTINTFCGVASGAGAPICTITDTAQVTVALYRQSIRGLVHEAQDGIGLGTCTSTLSGTFDAASCALTGGAGNTACGT